MSQILRLRPLAIGRAEIRRSGVIVHFKEEYEYSVFKICKVMQFDGVHISVFFCGGGGQSFMLQAWPTTSQRYLIPGCSLA